MSGQDAEIAIKMLYREMQKAKVLVPTSRWYLFGSITTTKYPVGDIDLLVVCESTGECGAVRAELAEICASFPFHLLLMTRAEEMEVKFVQCQNAVEITLGGQITSSCGWGG